MTNRIIRVLATAAMVLVGCVSGAGATGIIDDFSSNPYASPKQWCERWHHMHWDNANDLMAGENGTSCVNAAWGCCATCPTDGCVTHPGDAHYMITTANYTGTTRRAEDVVGWDTALSAAGGHHPALFPVAHPSCHQGFQGVIWRETNGTYSIQILRSDDALTGFAECGQSENQESSRLNVGTLSTSLLPRYKVKLMLVPHPVVPLGYTNATLTLVDTQTGTTLGTLTETFPITGWYNNQAKRFGIGGTPSFTYDSFDGDAS